MLLTCVRASYGQIPGYHYVPLSQTHLSCKFQIVLNDSMRDMRENGLKKGAYWMQGGPDFREYLPPPLQLPK